MKLLIGVVMDTIVLYLFALTLSVMVLKLGNIMVVK